MANKNLYVHNGLTVGSSVEINGTSGNVLTSGIVTTTNTTNASSTITGALQVRGGAGIGGNLYVGGDIVANKLTIQLTTVTTTLIETDDIIKTTNATQATATATGALQIAGGASVGGNLWVGGNIIGNVAATVSTATNANNVATVARTNNANHNLVFVDSNNASATFEALYTTSSFTVNPSTGKVDVGGTLTSTRDGSNTLIVYNSNATSSVGAGGITFKKNILLSSFVTFNEYASIAVEDSSGTTQGAIRFYKGDVGTYLGIQLDTFAGSTASSVLLATQNFVAVQTTSQATSTVTGALRVKGGVGIGGDLYVGGSIVGAVPTATNATNIAGGAAGRIPIQSGAGATSFVPTGSNGQVLTWSGTTATWATPAGGSTVETTARTTNANHFITFVDSNNASATAETVYTTSTFTINPSNGNVVIPGELTAGGTITSGQGVSTGDASFELGYYRTGAGPAYVDFHSTASTDFEARIIRYAGVNGSFDIVNNGTGGMVLSVEGSAPMVFKTVATERVRIESNGNVGIGTTSPGSRLDVSSTSSTYLRLVTTSAANKRAGLMFMQSSTPQYEIGVDAGVNNTRNLYVYDAVSATSRMIFDSAGNVGIGTTTPGSTLEVAGGIRARGGAPGANGVNNNGYAFSGNSGDNDSGMFSPADGQLDFYTNAALAMRISSGNVGIGTSSPSVKLDVSGGHIRMDDGYKLRWGDGTAAWEGSGAYDVLIGYTNNTERMRIDSAGNVGIGTTNPAWKLEVVDGSTQKIRLFNLVGNGNTIDFLDQAWQAQITGSAGNLIFNTGGTTERMRIDSAGNVGIGTTAPSGFGKLAVIGGNLGVSQDGGTVTTIRANANVCNIGAYNSTGTSLTFSTNASGSGEVERMRILSNGNVGIGTTSTTYKLEVNGSFAAITKSFVINHPTKPGMKLRYGSLEGPENGVYVRGRIQGKVIELPDYWTKLVDPESITVNLTPIGKTRMPSVNKIEGNKVYLNKPWFSKIDCYYVIFAERADVEKLETEI